MIFGMLGPTYDSQATIHGLQFNEIDPLCYDPSSD